MIKTKNKLFNSAWVDFLILFGGIVLGFAIKIIFNDTLAPFIENFLSIL